MSKEYIEREAALNCLKIARGYCPCAYKEISNLPTADVAPVVHGEWIELHEENGHEVGTCSHCRHVRIVDNYCPNCGAKMDGGNDND